MNKIIISVIVVVVLLVGGFFAWQWMASNNKVENTTNSTNTENQTTNTQAEGTLYMSITDAAVNMKNVTKIDMTVDKVQAYSQAEGWVTLSSTPQTYNLLELKAKSQAMMLGKATLPVGTWTEFKIHASKVMVTNSGKVQEAVLPSGDFNVKTNVMVNANTSSVAQFDVLADKSLHQTNTGQFIFAPAVTFSSRMNATVTVDDNNVLVATFGETNADLHLGMDIDGTIKTDFMVSPSTNLDIMNGLIKVNNGVKVILP